MTKELANEHKSLIAIETWRFLMDIIRPKSIDGWLSAREDATLNVYRSVDIAKGGSKWKHMVAFLGPSYLVAVGYMDPGNWATSLAGGSKFGYALLSVVLLSNLMAIVLQALWTRHGFLLIPAQLRA